MPDLQFVLQLLAYTKDLTGLSVLNYFFISSIWCIACNLNAKEVFWELGGKACKSGYGVIRVFSLFLLYQVACLHPRTTS